MHGQSHITDTHGKKHFKGYNYIHMLANWALRGLVPNYKRVCRKIPVKSMYRMSMRLNGLCWLYKSHKT